MGCKLYVPGITLVGMHECPGHSPQRRIYSHHDHQLEVVFFSASTRSATAATFASASL